MRLIKDPNIFCDQIFLFSKIVQSFKYWELMLAFQKNHNKIFREIEPTFLSMPEKHFGNTGGIWRFSIQFRDLSSPYFKLGSNKIQILPFNLFNRIFLTSLFNFSSLLYLLCRFSQRNPGISGSNYLHGV